MKNTHEKENMVKILGPYPLLVKRDYQQCQYNLSF